MCIKSDWLCVLKQTDEKDMIDVCQYLKSNGSLITCGTNHRGGSSRFVVFTCYFDSHSETGINWRAIGKEKEGMICSI